ncbi:hypothetical protein CEP88_13750 [Roseobacter denitrificans]|uniref:hypothetical protein n=1 Tax=Roseobacter denitrificans TaxID=2434 RepID=UPI0005C54AB0|nr:hypothetical protein [Roseobacter denitrificans]AVL53571.1 hypothetical protein CEP88_13750 [Roseobacter denitrificans]SFF72454.1 hypothetical protein SAMN05443635_101420 [Roseobacter denitrificans OCh 114]
MGFVVHLSPPVVNAQAGNSGRSLTASDKFVIGNIPAPVLSAWAAPINAKPLKNRVIQMAISCVSLSMPTTADLNEIKQVGEFHAS